MGRVAGVLVRLLLIAIAIYVSLFRFGLWTEEPWFTEIWTEVSDLIVLRVLSRIDPI